MVVSLVQFFNNRGRGRLGGEVVWISFFKIIVRFGLLFTDYYSSQMSLKMVFGKRA